MAECNHLERNLASSRPTCRSKSAGAKHIAFTFVVEDDGSLRPIETARARLELLLRPKGRAGGRPMA